MTMRVWLEGHEFDLQDLVDLFPSGDTRVERDQDGYFLTSTEIDDVGADLPYYETAQRVLARINGLARASMPGFRPVRLGGRFQDGHRTHVIMAAAPIEARARIAAAGVVASSDDAQPSEPPTPPGPTRAAVAALHPELDEALRILGEGERLDWIGMWKVYEIVRDSVKPQSIRKLGWATRTEDSDFRRAANDPRVSGSRARHARMGGNPPALTFAEDEGRAFISRLVTAWIDSRS